MSQMKDMNQRIPKLKNGLVISLVINWLVPIILYTVLRYFITDDTVTFAIVIAIPVVRTIFMFVLRHRIDLMGVNRNSVQTNVESTYSVFVNAAKKFFQIDTYGL